MHVAVNFGGIVSVAGTDFEGPEDLAVVEELSPNAPALPKGSAMLGWWSRPATLAKNRLFALGSAPEELPALSELFAGLGLTAGGGDASSGRRDPQRPAVPPAALRRICRTFPSLAWGPLGSEYYAIGNTVGYDVTAGGSPQPPKATEEATPSAAESSDEGRGPVRILLAACGDIRNLLATVAGAAGLSAAHPGGGDSPTAARLDCTLSDGNVSMLARNAVLLHLAAEQRCPPETVLAVWASHALTTEEAAALRQSIRSLAEDPWPPWLAAALSLDSVVPKQLPTGTSEEGALPHQMDPAEVGTLSLLLPPS